MCMYKLVKTKSTDVSTIAKDGITNRDPMKVVLFSYFNSSIKFKLNLGIRNDNGAHHIIHMAWISETNHILNAYGFSISSFPISPFLFGCQPKQVYRYMYIVLCTSIYKHEITGKVNHNCRAFGGIKRWTLTIIWIKLRSPRYNRMKWKTERKCNQHEVKWKIKKKAQGIKSFNSNRNTIS